jgi:hypothetical protein
MQFFLFRTQIFRSYWISTNDARSSSLAIHLIFVYHYGGGALPGPRWPISRYISGIFLIVTLLQSAKNRFFWQNRPLFCRRRDHLSSYLCCKTSLNHMKILSLFVAFSLLCSSVYCQKSFGNLIIGVESGFDVAQFSKGIKARMLPSIQAELSLGKISLGAGIGRKWYGDYSYYSFTGVTVEREVNDTFLRFYIADLHTFKPAYWTIPLKINYRLHRCDCVYLHAGITLEQVDLGRPDVVTFRGAEFDQPYAVQVERGQLVVPKTTSYELGVGFNLFRRDFFRLTAQPTYVLTRNPEVYSNGPALLPTLRFTFAAQFAVWRD